MAVVSMKQLLESGVHFGHATRRWNPKMAPYIFTSRNGIHIIDLKKTAVKIEEAYQALLTIVQNGGEVIFVGTKKQAQEAVADEAKRTGQYFVNQRWLGGTLTNFPTIRLRIKRLHELYKMEESGIFDKLPKKEVAGLIKERGKLEKNLGGIKEMKKIPQAMFIVDPRKELNAIREAKKLGIKVFGIVDTNCDPDEVDYIIPANDDAIRAVKLIAWVMGNAIIEGRGGVVDKFDGDEVEQGDTARRPQPKKAAPRRPETESTPRKDFVKPTQTVKPTAYTTVKGSTVTPTESVKETVKPTTPKAPETQKPVLKSDTVKAPISKAPTPPVKETKVVEVVAKDGVIIVKTGQEAKVSGQYLVEGTNEEATLIKGHKVPPHAKKAATYILVDQTVHKGVQSEAKITKETAKVIINTGQEVPISGQYLVDGSDMETTLVKGHKAPPHARKSATYILVDATKHKTEQTVKQPQPNKVVKPKVAPKKETVKEYLNKESLEVFTVAELRTKAKGMGLKRYSVLKKSELIDLITKNA